MRLGFLQIIGWMTFFGPAYVEKYGGDLLLGIPGYSVLDLGEDGIVHQLTPSILKQNRSEGPKLRAEVVDYFADHGIRVTCRAPYSL